MYLVNARNITILTPKLTRQMLQMTSQSLDPPQEPHIVPKLTIRNSTNASGSISQSVIVPKLTIKMDNHVSALAHQHQQSSNSDSSGSGCTVKLSIKPIVEPPIPKLTIKTNVDDHSEMIVVNNASISSNTNTKYSINASASGPNSPVTRATSKSQALKQLPAAASEQLVVPKLKIKPIINPDVSENCTTATGDTDTAAFVLPLPQKTVPKLVVRVQKDKNSATVSSIVDSNSTSATSADYEQTMDFDEDDDVQSIRNEINDLPPVDPVPKITIRQVKDPEKPPEENIVIPKVTIKPIVNPDDDSQQESETLITPKITIKPIPKPLDITQPLEVVTSFPISSTGGNSSLVVSTLKSSMSSFESPDSQQQSPRIILKINKQTQESVLTTAAKSTATSNIELQHSHVLSHVETVDCTISPSPSSLVAAPSTLNQDAKISSSNSNSNENLLKRSANCSITAISAVPSSITDMNCSSAKKPKLDNNNLNLVPLETIDLLDSPEHNNHSAIDRLMEQEKKRQSAVAAASAVLPSAISVSMVVPQQNATTAEKHFTDAVQSEEAIKLKTNVATSPMPRLQRPTRIQQFDNAAHNQSVTVTSPTMLITEVKKTTTVAPVIIAVTTTAPLLAATTAPSIVSITNTVSTCLRPNTSSESKPRLEFSGSLFPKYSSNVPSVQQPSIQIHPLLAKNIERANVLEAMMRPKPIAVEATVSNNIVAAAAAAADAMAATTKDVLSMSEGSSSDCILIEDNGSHPFGMVTSFDASVTDASNKNGRRDGECSVDRDSGVDVSNSLKSSSEELQLDMPPVKRGRGRPRKDVMSTHIVK